MDMNTRMRLNELAKDFDRCEVRRTLMREFGESETAYRRKCGRRGCSSEHLLRPHYGFHQSA